MTDWQEHALCAQTNPESFFPDISASRITAIAKKICAACDVRIECLNYALENKEAHGIWGGLTERERVRVGRHIEKTGGIEAKVCALDDCEDTIPLGSSPKRMYCTDRHAHKASERRYWETRKAKNAAEREAVA